MTTRKRRKKREDGQGFIAEHAAAYGVNLPDQLEPSERYLSPNEIGKILNLTGEAVKQWIYQRRLPAVKLANGYWKVKVSDFEAFLKARHEIGRRRVLITDTQEMSDIHTIVEKLGHQPVAAHNYADALLKSLDHHPALFIINCSTAAMEPWKLISKIRNTKALKSIPILLVADAELSEHDAERALELGAQGFVKRPANADLMSQEIGRILNRTM
jgi:CheY-like chemotaxis protein